MLSTENISTEEKLSKTLNPGNTIAKLLGISIETPSYDRDARVLNYHLEGNDRGANFEGFMIDKDNPSAGRYAGQIGRIRASYFAFKDFTSPKNNTTYKRDDSILTALAILGKALGKTEQLNKIVANTIEEYIPLASDILAGDKFLNWCIGGKEYLNKQNYINYDLFLPRSEMGRYPFEVLSASPSKLLTFDQDKHIIKLKKAAAVQNFGDDAADLSGNAMLPTPEITAPTGAGDDFDLPF